MMLAIDRDSSTPIFQQISEQIQQEIVAGSLSAHQTLTSTRTLAQDLDISRNTVRRAYEQLIIEGFIESKPKAGYRVVAHLPSIVHQSETAIQNRYIYKNLIDFMETFDKLEFFPQKDWSRAEQKMKLQGLQHVQPANGDLDYRIQLSTFLKRTKQIEVTPDQIVIVSGFNEAAGIIHTLVDFEAVSVVDPLAPNAQEIWKTMNVNVNFFKLHDDYQTWSKPPISLLTANHTFPNGNFLTTTERQSLAKKLIADHKYIIELDTDGTFNFEDHPSDSLMTYAPENSFYYSNYDDTLGSSLCIGFLVIPTKFQSKFQRLYQSFPSRVSQWQQRIIANMMADGSLTAYLRKLENVYNQRRKVLMTSLKMAFGEKINFIGSNRGTFIVSKLDTDKSVKMLCQIAKEHHIIVGDVDRSWQKGPLPYKIIVFSIRQVRIDEIKIGIRKLSKLWNL
ncbi:MAG: PLP-dependent aminotransferase family protein [Companilactobacillus sp.]|uniref:aminotransferase class I/II-fold pyridoxal phosphate-dependent enzyme n=2 Tax=Companilactobacillus sp. TaxID=2767905 RepID=UPI0025C66330|nr:PLP-dependent aminotransferase family protein [Companilactobacillus sp.]MCH4050662.1 PLP-dependent aminotransferase family protein [Companilactobacillus sp.]MCH4077101.1 PLP-dependent aminotransferase family protein [Companilactobacillus sp.]MCI1382985.1 PLP-dependent aminotransferase family protein [Companilactobacillus sp.]MCI1468440.1 PLP-dependent aminotransferase family protein [Companilactobacillus sp.]MCI1535841.1 PLP-dependent aminotransferase family protein [Companilactobacillus sp